MALRLPLPASADEYRSLLWEVLTCMDNERRPSVENCVVRSLNDPNTAFYLVQIINDQSSDPVQNAGIRQLAAVLLRKRVLSMWRGLELENRDELKSILLTQMGAEPVRLVRFAIAHVLCVLARVELRHGWPELLQAVHDASTAEAPEHRELACVLVHSLSKSIVDDTGDGGVAASNANLELAGRVVINCLNDDVWAVRKASLKAVGALAPLLGNTRNVVRTALANELVPRAMALITECGGAASSSSARPSEVTRVAMEAIEVLEFIMEARGAKFEYLDEIIATLMRTAASTDAHVRVREEATEVLIPIINRRPKLIVKRGLVEPLLQLGIALVSEDDTIAFEAPDPDDEDEEEGFGDDDGDGDDGDDDAPRAPTVFGGRLLTALGDSIASKRIVPPVMEVLGQHLSDTSADPRARKGALVAAACISGGCGGAMRQMVERLVRACEQYAADESPCVRASAAHALLHFATNLQPEILAMHSTLIPMLLQQLDDPEDSVRGRVARTFEGVCDEMGEDLEPYVGALISKLVAIIPASSESTQRYVCGALAAIANGKSASVSEYAGQIFELLQPATQPSASSMLRAKAIEAVGILAFAVGTSIFTADHFAFFWEQVCEAFTSKVAQLREMCFGFCANVVKVLGQDFAPYATPVVEAALMLLNDETGGGKIKSSNPLASAGAGFEFAEDDEGREYRMSNGDNESEDDDAADLGEEYTLVVRQADVEEKTAALYCLGELAAHLGPAFGEYMDAVVDALENGVMHAHTPIRINAIHALVQTVVAKQMLGYLPDAPPEVIEGVMPTDEMLCEGARAAMDDLIRAELLPIMNTDDSARVVASACDAIVDLTRRLGAVAIHPYLDDILEATSALLRKEAPCQDQDEDGDEDGDGAYDGGYGGGGNRGNGGDDDDEDHDNVLIDSVSEIVDTMCKAYGPCFAPHFQQLAGDLLPYTAPDRPGEDHVFSVGVIAASLEALGAESVGVNFGSAADIAFGLIGVTPESVARSNCCFLIRVLVELGGTNVTQPFVMQALQSLSAIIGAEDEMPSTVDNAVSATCSIVRCCAGMIPMEFVLPELLVRLPMRIDASENANAVRCLVSLCNFAEQIVAMPSPTFEQFVHAVGRTLVAPKVTRNDKASLFGTFSHYVIKGQAAAFQQASAGLPPDQLQAMRSVFG